MSIHEPLRLFQVPHDDPSSCFGRRQGSPYIGQPEENKRVREKTDDIVQTGDVSSTEANPTVLEDKDLDEQYYDILAPWIYTARNADVSVISGLVDVLRQWYGVVDSDAVIISRCVELIHISSLMLDDTEAATPSRRGRPTAHFVFGAAQTVQSSKFMTIRGIKELAKLRNAECMRILLDEIVRRSFTSRQKDAPVPPSVDDHIEALDQKSGSIIRLIDTLMAAASPLPSHEIPAADHLMNLYARLYALRDDYANLAPPSTSSGYECKTSTSLEAKIQSFYTALDEGRYSLLLVHALNVLPDDRGILLKQIITRRGVTGRFEAQHKPLVLEILRRCGSFEFVVGLIRDLQGEIMHALDEFEIDGESFCLDGRTDGNAGVGYEIGGHVEGAGQGGSDIDVNGFRLLVQRLRL